MNILITGGTGSLGKALIRLLREDNKVCVYSRDEGKHALLDNDICKMIGDVRDRDRLDYVMHRFKPDIIYHCAAQKRLDDMELHPDECIKTNVDGSQNVAWAADKHNVKRCILVSTDKACQPVNVYGASKFIAERLFTNWNFHSATIFGCVRYGNVIASRGSFVPLWREKILNSEIVNITSLDCTRFLFTLDDAARFVIQSANICSGGEVFVPIMSSYKIGDVLKSLYDICDKPFKEPNLVGMRPGEKYHEDMIAEVEMNRCWNIVPNTEFKIFNKDIVGILPEYYSIPFIQYGGSKYTGDRLNSEFFVNENKQDLKDLIVRGLNESI